MGTFEKHKEASIGFQKKIAESGLDALKELGKAMREVGDKIAYGQKTQEPGPVLADAILGLAGAHSKFRAGAIEAASEALKTVRRKPVEEKASK